MPVTICWSRRRECSGRGTSSSSRSGGGSGHASGPEALERLVGVGLLRAQQLHPRPLPRAELAQPQLAALREADEQPRGLVRSEARLGCSWSRPADIRWSSSDRSPSSRNEQLAAPAHAGERAALERVQRRVERLQRVDAGRERRLDGQPCEGGAQPAGGDLHLGELWHTSTLEWRRHGSVGAAGGRRDRRARRAGARGARRACRRRRATCTAPRSAPRCAPRSLPDEAAVERIPCSSPGHAPDLLARLRGHGRAAGAAARPRRHRGRAPRATSRCAATASSSSAPARST